MAGVDHPLLQKILDIAQLKRELHVQHHSGAINAGVVFKYQKGLPFVIRRGYALSNPALAGLI